MKLFSALLISALTTVSAFAASDNQKISRFFSITNHQAISSVSADEANKMFHEFCSTAGEFHYSKHSSVSNSIDFDGSRDFNIRCNILNTQRGLAAGKGLVCVGNTKILNEREDFVEVTTRKRIELTGEKGSCSAAGTYNRDQSDDTNYEVFEDSVFIIVSL